MIVNTMIVNTVAATSGADARQIHFVEQPRRLAYWERQAGAPVLQHSYCDPSTVAAVVGRGSSTAIATGTTILRRLGLHKSAPISSQRLPRNIAAMTSLR